MKEQIELFAQLWPVRPCGKCEKTFATCNFCTLLEICNNLRKLAQRTKKLGQVQQKLFEKFQKFGPRNPDELLISNSTKKFYLSPIRLKCIKVEGIFKNSEKINLPQICFKFFSNPPQIQLKFNKNFIKLQSISQT